MVIYGYLVGVLSWGMWWCSCINLIVDIIVGIIFIMIGIKV